MKKPYVFEKDNEQYSLQDCVEICTIGLAESIFKNEKRAEDIMQDREILNSLTNALIAIKM